MVKLNRTLSRQRRWLCRQTQAGDSVQGYLLRLFATQTYVAAERVENPKWQKQKAM